ncbi:hypothetical protein QQ73_04055 [Candidatus Endoriftia persephone str. Guaymas]|nr:hypothetical protein [Candidatus Endoriftia persephone str. Guaymas]
MRSGAGSRFSQQLKLQPLVRNCKKHSTPAYLIDGAEDIDRSWLAGKARIGVSAGASAPEVLVERVLERLQEWGADQINEGAGKTEEVVFSLPKALQN